MRRSARHRSIIHRGSRSLRDRVERNVSRNVRHIGVASELACLSQLDGRQVSDVVRETAGPAR